MDAPRSRKAAASVSRHAGIPLGSEQSQAASGFGNGFHPFPRGAGSPLTRETVGGCRAGPEVLLARDKRGSPVSIP